MKRRNIFEGHFDKAIVLVLLLVVAFSLVAGCAKKFRSQEYLPLRDGYAWTFNGLVKRREVVGIKDLGISTDFMVASYDTTGALVWQDVLRESEESIYWESFKPGIGVLPQVSFQPPIPFSPFSDKLGAKKAMTVTLVQQDSVISYYNVSVNYEIDSLDPVTVPAGHFENCIRVHFNIQYLQPVPRPYFAGDYFLWFAKGVGLVKYIMPGDRGDLVLAFLGDKTLP